MTASAAVLDLLAQALIRCPSASPGALSHRIERLFARRPPWSARVVRGYLAEFGPAAAGDQPRPRQRDVVDWLLQDRQLVTALRRVRRLAPLLSEPALEPAQMIPVAAARSWPVPAIESPGALAAWLGLGPEELEWFADLARLASRAGISSPAHHYFYRALVKPGGRMRLIEAPQARLKMLQHRILHGVLSAVPPHPAAHGFRRGRSIRSFAAPHTGQAAVLRLDLAHFFPSIGFARIAALFRTMGYPEPVADRLAGLATNATPRAAWRGVGREAAAAEYLVEAIRLHARRHLPQGAPSSPALANLCAYKLDCRLAGLAEAAGAVAYTRYADDLAFSGGPEFARAAATGRLAARIAAIAAEEGFAVNHHKTRLMRDGVRQHLAGLVVNERLNVSRADFDELKATLHNCARHGPASQNRDAHPAFREHLAGRVAFLESVHPARGARLRALLNQIDWS